MPLCTLTKRSKQEIESLFARQSSHRDDRVAGALTARRIFRSVQHWLHRVRNDVDSVVSHEPAGPIAQAMGLQDYAVGVSVKQRPQSSPHGAYRMVVWVATF